MHHIGWVPTVAAGNLALPERYQVIYNIILLFLSIVLALLVVMVGQGFQRRSPKQRVVPVISVLVSVKGVSNVVSSSKITVGVLLPESIVESSMPLAVSIPVWGFPSFQTYSFCWDETMMFRMEGED